MYERVSEWVNDADADADAEKREKRCGLKKQQ
jgi:hypothetical protein